MEWESLVMVMVSCTVATGVIASRTSLVKVVALVLVEVNLVASTSVVVCLVVVLVVVYLVVVLVVVSPVVQGKEWLMPSIPWLWTSALWL
jgi:hypothetical protein